MPAATRPTPIEIVFFDLGGTLLDTRNVGAWDAAARGVGVAVDMDHLVHAYTEVDREMDAPGAPESTEEFWRRILERAGAGPVTAEQVEGFVEAVFREPRVTALFSDARRCLEEIESLGLRRGIISNSRSEESVRRLLAEHSLAATFTPVVSSGTEGVRKPAPEIFRRAAERAGLPAERCFHVGDLAVTDAKGAAAAGFRSVWLNREGTGFGEDPPEITSLTELPGYLQLLGLVVPRAGPVK